MVYTWIRKWMLKMMVRYHLHKMLIENEDDIRKAMKHVEDLFEQS